MPSKVCRIHTSHFDSPKKLLWRIRKIHSSSKQGQSNDHNKEWKKEASTLIQTDLLLAKEFAEGNVRKKGKLNQALQKKNLWKQVCSIEKIPCRVFNKQRTILSNSKWVSITFASTFSRNSKIHLSCSYKLWHLNSSHKAPENKSLFLITQTKIIQPEINKTGATLILVSMAILLSTSLLTKLMRIDSCYAIKIALLRTTFATKMYTTYLSKELKKCFKIIALQLYSQV